MVGRGAERHAGGGEDSKPAGPGLAHFTDDDNGLSAAEAGEVLAHVAFYAGWSRAMSAVPVLRGLLAGRGMP